MFLIAYRKVYHLSHEWLRLSVLCIDKCLNHYSIVYNKKSALTIPWYELSRCGGTVPTDLKSFIF
jgi:hypothetical protein